MVAYGGELQEIGPRQRIVTASLGSETMSYLKKKTNKRKKQQNYNNIAAEDFRRTVKAAGVICFFLCLSLIMQWEYQSIDTKPISLSSHLGSDAQYKQDTQKQDKTSAWAKENRIKPVSHNVQAMLRRVRNKYTDVHRNARKPSHHYEPSPKISIPPNLDNLLADVSEPKLKSEVPFFWHILKSGGTTVKDAAGMCLGKVESSESGVLDGHDNDIFLQKVRISQGSIEYMNGMCDQVLFHVFNQMSILIMLDARVVDTTSKIGIKRAISMNLVESGLSDIIFSPLLHESSQLFNNTKYKGRAFCLFRHPVERAVSLFHYLKHASWEPTFNEKIKSIQTVEDYAISEFAENNWMTRFLTNEMSGAVTRKHLEVAKEIIRRKIFVGLTGDLENSFERFMKYFGWTTQDLTEEQRRCLKEYLSGGSNRNKHQVEENSIGWRVLRSNNILDLELYDYVLQLYEEQTILLLGS